MEKFLIFKKINKKTTVTVSVWPSIFRAKTFQNCVSTLSEILTVFLNWQ